MKTSQFDHSDVNEQRKLHKAVLEKVKAMTPEEGFKDLIESGIYTEEGNLAPEYSGSPRETKKEANEGRNLQS